MNHAPVRSTDFGSAWAALVRRVFARDGHRCQKCRSRERLGAHHIKPRSEGGEDIERNLITLCAPCHDWAELATSDGEGMTWDDLVRPPSVGQDKHLRAWFRDKRGYLTAYVLD